MLQAKFLRNFTMTAFALFAATSARADIITLNPIADGYVTSPDNDPYPSSYSILSTSGNLFLGGGSATQNSFRAALEFSLSGLPSGSTINSATFSFVQRRVVFSGTTGLSFDLRTYAGDGSISVADFPQTGSPVSSFNLTTGTSGYVNLDVTSSVQTLLGANASFIGVELAPQSIPASPDFYHAQLNSTESLTNRPLLVIDYTPAAVPEPTALLLSVIGGVGVGAGRYLRRRQPIRQA